MRCESVRLKKARRRTRATTDNRRGVPGEACIPIHRALRSQDWETLKGPPTVVSQPYTQCTKPLAVKSIPKVLYALVFKWCQKNNPAPPSLSNCTVALAFLKRCTHMSLTMCSLCYGVQNPHRFFACQQMSRHQPVHRNIAFTDLYMRSLCACVISPKYRLHQA